MPTAAKLIAALALGLAAYGAVGVAEFRFSILGDTGVNAPWIAFVAALVGWAHLGPLADRGYTQTIAGGIAASAIAFGLVVLAAACLHVINAVQYHAYKDVDAMLDGFILKAIQYAAFISDWPVLAAMLAGGALAGIFTGFAGRLWA